MAPDSVTPVLAALAMQVPRAGASLGVAIAPSACVRDEPRIELVAKLISSLLDVVDLQYEGTTVRPDGFRLRNTRSWADQCEDSLMSNLGSLSSTCNCHCEFCYEVDSPPGLFDKSKPRMTLEEAEARRRLMDDGQPMFREYRPFLEPFANSDVIPILRIVRDREPDSLIEVTTNGSALDERVVAQLAELKPLFVSLSLNSSSEDVRRFAMHDHRAATAVRAPELLRTYEIPYMGSIVPWPTVPLSDLLPTILWLAERDAHSIRVCLPGAGREHERRGQSVSQSWWDAIVGAVEEARSSVKTPVILSPYTYAAPHVTPTVEGVIPNSPAARAGIEVGDEIVAVDGKSIVSRADARAALRRAQSSGSVRVVWSRDGNMTEAPMNESGSCELDWYPYKPRGYDPLRLPGSEFGICLPDGLSLRAFKRIHEIVVDAGARNVALLTSTLMQPVVEGLLHRLPLPEGTTVHAVRVRNEYFGGNICLGDLWTNDDVLTAIAEHSKTAGVPDLVLVPGSYLSRWQRDLAGGVFREVAARSRTEVRLIECSSFVL